MRMLLTHNPEGLFSHANWQGKILLGQLAEQFSRTTRRARTSYRRSARKIGVAPNKEVEAVSGLQKKSGESGSRVNDNDQRSGLRILIDSSTLRWSRK
jgi:hypothetical protein